MSIGIYMMRDHKRSGCESVTFELATIKGEVGLEDTVPRSRSTSVERHPQDVWLVGRGQTHVLDRHM